LRMSWSIADGARSTSPWPPAGAFGLPRTLAGGIRRPASTRGCALCGRPHTVGEAWPSQKTRPNPHPSPMATWTMAIGRRGAWYFADSAQPLPKSEIAALPEAAVARTPSHLRPALSYRRWCRAQTAVRRPQLPQTSIPKWATSSDDRRGQAPEPPTDLGSRGLSAGSQRAGGWTGRVLCRGTGKSWNACWEAGSRLPRRGHRPQRPAGPGCRRRPGQN